MKVRLKGKEYNFVISSVWGPLYTYEKIAGKKLPFDATNILSLHLLFYCVLLRSNDDVTITLDDFFECLNNVELANDLMNYYNIRMELLTSEAQDNYVIDDKKKE